MSLEPNFREHKHPDCDSKIFARPSNHLPFFLISRRAMTLSPSCTSGDITRIFNNRNISFRYTRRTMTLSPSCISGNVTRFFNNRNLFPLSFSASMLVVVVVNFASHCSDTNCYDSWHPTSTLPIVARTSVIPAYTLREYASSQSTRITDYHKRAAELRKLTPEHRSTIAISDKPNKQPSNKSHSDLRGSAMCLHPRGGGFPL